MFYVYEHIRPDTNKVFYVGKGSGYRSGITQHRNNYWKNIVAKAGGFSVRKIAENIDEELAFFIEQERIDQLKKLGIKISNLTEGGEGSLNPSKETRQKMSKAHLGEKNPRFSFNSKRQKTLRGEIKKKSKEEISANMRKFHWSKTGVYVPKKGYKLSVERKEKLCHPRPSVANGNNPKAKTIVYDDKKFSCIKEFASFLNVNYKTLVVKIRGVKRTVFLTDDFNSLTNGRVAFN